VHNDFLEEIAKFRSARRIWAKIMKERFHAQDNKSLKLRFHSQTAGSTLTAQQPLNNVVRVSLQAMAAVLGGTQSLHTNSLDEALALPTEESARLALRTQQIIAYESLVTQTVDPLAGSYYIESLTDELEKRTFDYLREIEARGGTVACIESGYLQTEILNSAYSDQRRIDSQDLKVVGVNCFKEEYEASPKLQKISPEVEKSAVQRIQAFRKKRGSSAVQGSLKQLKDGAQGGANLQELVIQAAEAGATLGEMADVLREVFGEFQNQKVF
jgi:methylmalonyl-CoA mutase N-terminal domain/subunit